MLLVLYNLQQLGSLATSNGSDSLPHWLGSLFEPLTGRDTCQDRNNGSEPELRGRDPRHLQLALSLRSEPLQLLWSPNLYHCDLAKNLKIRSSQSVQNLNLRHMGDDDKLYFSNLYSFNCISGTLSHTVILEYFNIKVYVLSNFAFQSFQIFIGTQDKKNFSNSMMHFLGPD